MGLFGIILSLVLLMYLAYRGINVLILAPLLALLAVLLSGDIPLLATYTQVFMQALGNYLITYFPLFMLGAIFGKLMADSGSARAIAEWCVSKLGASNAIVAIVLSCGSLPMAVSRFSWSPSPSIRSQPRFSGARTYRSASFRRQSRLAPSPSR